MPVASNSSPTFLRTWVVAQYIPTFVFEPLPSSSTVPPSPRPYAGSIVDLVDSMGPAIFPTCPPAVLQSPKASTRTAQPFPLVDLVSADDGPSKVGRKRKLSGGSPVAGGSSSHVLSEKRRRESASDRSSEEDVIILSDNDVPDREVIVISD